MIKHLLVAAAFLSFTACDTQIPDIPDISLEQPATNPCPAVLDCMTTGCTYQENAAESRVQGYTAGCVEACMGIYADPTDDWVRGTAGMAFVSCETGADSCDEHVLACLEG